MRLIDADELDYAFTMQRFYPDGSLAHWGDRKDWCMHGSDVERLIADAPTVDTVPVVRCKDCRYWDKDDSDRELCMCKVLGTRTMPMWFCWAGYPWEDGEAQG